MKLTNMTVAQLTLAAARRDVIPSQGNDYSKLKDTITRALNDVAWGINWSNQHGVVELSGAQSLMDVFKAARERVKEIEQDEVIVSLDVNDDGGKTAFMGLYLYVSQLGLLIAREWHPDNTYHYSLFFSHPDSEEIERHDGEAFRSMSEPYELLPVDEKFFELTSATAGIKPE